MIDYICDYLALHGDLNDEKKKVIYYGLFVTLTNFFSYISVLLIGYLLAMFYETSLLLLFYSPLRLYVGGYHCKTALRCYFSFSSLFLLVLLFLKLIDFSLFIFLIIDLIGLIYCLFIEKIGKTVNIDKNK